MKTRMFFLGGIFACLLSAPFFSGCNDTTNPAPVAPPDNSTISCPAAEAVSRAISSTPVQSHIPRAVQSYADQGRVSQDQELSVTVALALNNENDLDQQLHDLYDPTSAGYHQFMKPAEFRARYAPTPEQVADVTSFLSSKGLHDFALGPNGYMLHAQGSVGSLNSAFSTEIHQYRDSNGAPYFAPASEPVLPISLPIRAVHGLQNVTHFHRYLKAFNAARPANAHGSGPNGGLSPADIRVAYSLPTTVNGAGQTLALFELDGYSASDISNYERYFGLSQVSLQNVLVDGASGSAGSAADEVTLDIELMTAIAPGASKVMVYEGPNSGQAILDIYSKIANDDEAQEVSTSWGAPEDQTSAAFTASENTIFKQMAAQGQAIYAAAGDAGAYDDGSSLSTDDPGTQPYVVSVGGTHLNYNGTYVSESSWNDGFGDAGGGGFSSVWAIPSWQSGAVSPASLGCATQRNVPDVSLEADPNAGYAIFFRGGWTIFGGTSCAAPLWAGFTALVNQQRNANGLSTLGFPDPAIYAVGKGASYGSDFHDIADGSTNLHYPAIPGYDDSTGWGSFIGTGLFNSLSTY